MRELAEKIKALGEPTRLKVLRLLHERELCVCEIAEVLQMSQPRISQHLKVLRQAGLVSERKIKKWSYYALVPGAVGTLFQRVEKAMTSVVESLPEMAEEFDRLAKVTMLPPSWCCSKGTEGERT